MKKNQLTKKIFIALVSGITLGVLFLFLRQHLLKTGQEALWHQINSLLFQDINHVSGAKSFGILYITGQLFINALQLVIIPMVFTSILMAVTNISDSKTLKRISLKTFIGFGGSSILALIFASLVGLTAYKRGLFTTSITEISNVTSNSIASNPLTTLTKAIPQNMLSGLSNNGNVLATVVLGIVIGLVLNHINDKDSVVKKFIVECNKISQIFLSFVINKFAPIAIFSLLTRTFAIYGITYLQVASIYFIVTAITLFIFLTIGYALIIWASTGLNPIPFMKKISNVAMFAFSTSSSAATLPINTKTTVEKLGVDKTTSSFVL
ncbi:MAG: dicarboxylate/amino acid:cation symporter, partial [Fusobacteriaceae bacterium]